MGRAGLGWGEEKQGFGVNRIKASRGWDERIVRPERKRDDGAILERVHNFKEIYNDVHSKSRSMNVAFSASKK